MTIFDNTVAVHDRVESNLFNLLIENSPYDPRLEEAQEDVSEIADLGRMHAEQHSKLQEQVVTFTALINVTLRQESSQLEVNLDFLKTISTPVFIQALAAEELMNRTITEFQVAQEEITKLVEFYIPNITQSLSVINESNSLTMEALQSLTSQLQMLNTRANEIALLASQLTSITNASVVTIYDIQMLNEEIEGVTKIIQQNISYIEQTVHSLTQQVRRISMDIMELTVSIGEQLDTTPTIPSPDSIEQLQATLSTSQSTVQHLNDQLVVKGDDISRLQDVSAEQGREVDSLLDILLNFSKKAEDLEHQVENASSMTMAAVSDVDHKLSQAEQVLQNLQNFSDDTFDVAKRANEALSSVEGLTTEANIILEKAAAIQQNVSGLRNTLQDATYNTHDADNTTTNAAMVSIQKIVQFSVTVELLFYIILFTGTRWFGCRYHTVHNFRESEY